MKRSNFLIFFFLLFSFFAIIYFFANSLASNNHLIRFGPSYSKIMPLREPQCADGIDNDNDGRVDYPDDCGCTSYQDNDENGTCPNLRCIEVRTPQDLDRVRNNLTGHYCQMRDIDMNGINFTIIGRLPGYGVFFTGVYDGQGYSISNLSGQRGLFGENKGTIKNLRLDNLNLRFNSSREIFGYVAGITTENLDGGIIENCSVYGNISVSNMSSVGGLVGYNYGTIKNSRSYVTIADLNLSDNDVLLDVGGLAGVNFGVIRDSIMGGRIKGGLRSYEVGGLVGSISEDQNFRLSGIINSSFVGSSILGAESVGGLVGFAAVSYGSNLTIQDSSSYGNVLSSVEGGRVGGLVGTGVYANIFNSFSESNVSGRYQVGGLVGYGTGGIIKNSSFSGTVYGRQFVGGLVGDFSGVQLGGVDTGAILDSYSSGEVRGALLLSSYVGGLVGELSGIGINNSYSSAKVSGDLMVGGLAGYAGLNAISLSFTNGTVNGSLFVGGLVGQAQSENIDRSFSQVNIFSYLGDFRSGSCPTPGCFGGLIGYFQQGFITNSYSKSNLNVPDASVVGGFIGKIRPNDDCLIQFDYSVGAVNALQNTGGLIADAINCATIDSYWDIETSEQSQSSGGIGKTTAEMQQQSTFANWDFNNTWRMPSGNYPRLRWQN